jgi:hypothetical protein
MLQVYARVSRVQSVMSFFIASLLTLHMLGAQHTPQRWAQTLVPLLDAIRADLGPKVTIGPGTLPPSPITGRSAALVAIRVGFRDLEVEPEVLEAIDRLLQVQRRKETLAEADRSLIERWVDELRVKVLARLAGRGQAVECDDLCLAGHLTQADAVFEGDARARKAERDYVLLEALRSAVLEAS